MHHFLCEASLFCDLVRAKQTPDTPAPVSKCGDETPWLLSSGGRGISATPGVPARHRLGLEGQGRGIPLAGVAYEVSRRWYARQTRAYERAWYALGMVEILEVLEAKWGAPRSWYHSVMV